MRRWFVGLLILAVAILAGCRVEEGAPTPLLGRTPSAGSVPATGRPLSPTPVPRATPTSAEVVFPLTVVHSGEVVGKVRPCG
ncbi:MAG: hypothetical protein ACP5SI_01430 [Chloroflexia bacterium]